MLSRLARRTTRTLNPKPAARHTPKTGTVDPEPQPPKPSGPRIPKRFGFMVKGPKSETLHRITTYLSSILGDSTARTIHLGIPCSKTSGGLGPRPPAADSTDQRAGNEGAGYIDLQKGFGIRVLGFRVS